MNIRKISLLILALVAATLGIEARRAASHVVIIGMDGWGAYSVPKADIPQMKQMMADGSFTLHKRSVLPSSSALNWATMFMGAGTEVHGYTEWNSKVPEAPSWTVCEHGIFPTVFHLLRKAEPQAEIGVMYEWDGIKYVVDTLALSYYAQAPDYEKNPTLLTEMAEQYITEKKPRLVAICFDNPDHVGHKVGHDTPEYYDKLKELDGYVKRIVEATKRAGIYDETVFVLTSDHGGKGKGHGGKTMLEMETPFIICGKGIRQGHEIMEPTMQYDVAATVARVLGLEQPQVWTGRPMKSVFGKKGKR